MSADFHRIISLVPSLTELLFALGLGDRLVGRTRFCIHPEEKVKNIPVIGGTKNPNREKIREADPDFILANKEENRKKDIELLGREFHIHLTDITTIEDALIDIHELGTLFGVASQAKELTQKISDQLGKRPDEPPICTAYLIWKEPWMTVGSDTYIHDVMEHWGLTNIFSDMNRYPKISLQSMKQRNPELVLLSSEPYPFKEKHVEEVSEMLPHSRVLPVEGEWFSWYGARMLHAFERLNVWRKAIA